MLGRRAEEVQRRRVEGDQTRPNSAGAVRAPTHRVIGEGRSNHGARFRYKSLGRLCGTRQIDWSCGLSVSPVFCVGMKTSVTSTHRIRVVARAALARVNMAQSRRMPGVKSPMPAPAIARAKTGRLRKRCVLLRCGVETLSVTDVPVRRNRIDLPSTRAS